MVSIVPTLLTKLSQTNVGDSVKCHNFTIFSDINTQTLKSKGQLHKTSLFRGQEKKEEEVEVAQQQPYSRRKSCFLPQNEQKMNCKAGPKRSACMTEEEDNISVSRTFSENYRFHIG